MICQIVNFMNLARPVRRPSASARAEGTGTRLAWVECQGRLLKPGVYAAA
jgi:hypothetical protein